MQMPAAAVAVAAVWPLRAARPSGRSTSTRRSTFTPRPPPRRRPSHGFRAACWWRTSAAATPNVVPGVSSLTATREAGRRNGRRTRINGRTLDDDGGICFQQTDACRGGLPSRCYQRDRKRQPRGRKFPPHPGRDRGHRGRRRAAGCVAVYRLRRWQHLASDVADERGGAVTCHTARPRPAGRRALARALLLRGSRRSPTASGSIFRSFRIAPQRPSGAPVGGLSNLATAVEP